MTSYFLQITSRANQAVGTALQPAFDFNPARQSTDDKKQGETEEVNYPSSQDKAPDGLIVPTPVPTSTGSENWADPFLSNDETKEKTDVPLVNTRYFSRHVERSIIMNEQKVLQSSATVRAADKPVVTEGATVSGPGQQTNSSSFEKNTRLQPENEQSDEKRTNKPSRDLEEAMNKPQLPLAAAEENRLQRRNRLEPSAENSSGQGKETHHSATPLRPSHILTEGLDARSKRGNKQVPKLVIGKITVEVLPPEKPSLPKVVTRIVQPAAVPQSSKPNKFGFGLGQL